MTPVKMSEIALARKTRRWFLLKPYDGTAANGALTWDRNPAEYSVYRGARLSAYELAQALP